MVPMIKSFHDTLLPKVDAIEAQENLSAFVKRTLKNRPQSTPGKHTTMEYDSLRDCPDPRRCSSDMVLAGGPLKAAWLDCESHGVFKKGFRLEPAIAHYVRGRGVQDV